MMDGLVLKRSVGGIEHLVFLCLPHMSPKESMSLPFEECDEIWGNCCHGLFYFNSIEVRLIFAT